MNSIAGILLRLKKIYCVVFNAFFCLCFSFVGCVSRKEFEAATAAAQEAQRDADKFKTYTIIAIAFAIVGIVVFLVVGNMMGSKTRRDHDFPPTRKEIEKNGK